MSADELSFNSWRQEEYLSLPVHPGHLWAHTISYQMSYGDLSPWEKISGLVALTTHLHLV
jgi:hypothetical protein